MVEPRDPAASDAGAQHPTMSSRASPAIIAHGAGNARALVTAATEEGADFLEVDHGKFTAKFARIPHLSDVPFAVQMEPNLVVEFYSR